LLYLCIHLDNQIYSCKKQGKNQLVSKENRVSIEEAEQAFQDGLLVIHRRFRTSYQGRIKTIAPRSSFQFQFEGESDRETLLDFVNASSLSFPS